MRILPKMVMDRVYLNEVVNAYLDFDEFVFDVETMGKYRLRHERADVRWISLAGPGRSDVIPLGHPKGRVTAPPVKVRRPVLDDKGNAVLTAVRKVPAMETAWLPAEHGKPPKQLYPGPVFEALRPLFFGTKVWESGQFEGKEQRRRKVGANVKFDLTAVSQFYEKRIPPPPYGDVAIVCHLLDEHLHNYKLKFLVEKYMHFSYKDPKIGELGIENFDLYTVAKYSRSDAWWAWLLWKKRYPLLDEQELLPAFKVEMALLEVLAHMEREGALIDTKRMDEIDVALAKRMEEIQDELIAEYRRPWKLTNSIEKGKFVYEHCGHDPIAFSEKTNRPSTRAEVLAVFGAEDKRVAKLSEFANLSKIHSTYIVGMRNRLIDGKLHASFLQWGTETGRLSCISPNLQNLPRDTPEREEYSIRSLFIPPPGYVMIVADYSQIEYRLFADFSGDAWMIQQFERGIDAHAAVGGLILNKDPAKLTASERAIGKTFNFALGFGAGATRLSEQGNMTEDQAKFFLRKHRADAPGFYKWKNDIIDIATALGYSATKVGRRRRLGALHSDDKSEKAKADRQAVNHRIQGTAADILKRGMIRLFRETRGTDIKMILTVHDELVCIAPEEEKDTAKELIRKVMESPAELFGLKVPLLVNIDDGPRWSEAKS